MATLGTTALVAYLALGGKKASKTDGPPINASSSDEERFIRCVAVVLYTSFLMDFQRRHIDLGFAENL